MSLNPYLSSAQQLLNLAHHQAQQMLSLAYEQAQQLLTFPYSQQSKPPSLMSVCKAHMRPACPLAPCVKLLYNRSKVTSEKLHTELVKKSKPPRDLVTVKTQTCLRVKSPTRIKPSCIMKGQQSEHISDICSPTNLSLLKQTLAKLEPLFAHEHQPLLVTTAFPSARVNSSVKPSVEHSSATHCSVTASAQLSFVPSSTVPTAEALSIGDVQAAGIPFLAEDDDVADELFLEELSVLSYPTQGSLMVEQPRAPSAFSPSPHPSKRSHGSRAGWGAPACR